MTKRTKVLIVIGIIAVVLVVLFTGARIWLDVLWFDHLSYLSVFSTILFTKIGLWFAFFMLFLLFAGLNLVVAFRRGDIQTLKIPRSSPPQPGIPAELAQGAPVEINRKTAVSISVVALLFLGVILAGTGSSRWSCCKSSCIGPISISQIRFSSGIFLSTCSFFHFTLF